MTNQEKSASGVERSGIPRRTVLKGIGILAASLPWLDAGIGELLWDKTSTKLTPYRELTRDEQLHPWVTAPGLGMLSGRYISHAYDQYANGGNSVYFELPEQHASTEAMAEALLPYMETAQSVNVIGASMGGVTALEAIRQSHLERPVETIVMVSSPFDIDDARGALLARARDVLYRLQATSGPIEHAFNRVVLDFVQGRLARESFASELQKIEFEITQGNPMSISVSGIHMLVHADLRVHAEDYRGTINGNTVLYYAYSPDDGAVYTEQALAKWRDFMDEFGATVEPVVVPRMQHADVETALPAVWEQKSVT